MKSKIPMTMFRTMNFLSKILIINILILQLAFSPTSAVAETSPNSIGVILPLSGEVAEYGAKVREGIESASHNGIDFVYEDDACQSAKAISAYQNLKWKGTKFFLGPCCGSSMKAVASRYSTGQQISMATCPITDLSHSVSGGRIFMPQYSVEKESIFNAEQIFSKGFKKVVLLYQETELANSHKEAFSKNYKGSIVASLAYNNPDVSELRTVLLKLKRLDYDALYVPHVEPLLLGFLREMEKMGLAERQVFSIYSAQMLEVIEINGKRSEGLLYSYPDIPLDANAISYFPKLGAEMLISAINACDGEYACVLTHLKTNYNFSDKGVLENKIVLREIRDGKFTLLDKK